MVRLMPKDTKFFDMFAEMAANISEGARLLEATLRDFKDVEARVKELKALEHKGDDMTHAVLIKLNQTFITPFDREDIHQLASKLDDILDYMYAAGERLVMYKIHAAPPAAAELANVVVRQADQLAKAVSMLERHDNVLEICVEINRLENEADDLARAAIARLFEGGHGPIEVIKWKEIYETMETATDRCEDAANIMEGIFLKNA